jgi:ribosomal protein S27AE
MPYYRQRRNRNPSSRNSSNIDRLYEHIEDQQSRIAELNQLLRAAQTLSSEKIAIEGMCVECGDGVLFHKHDRLYCPGCGYVAYL